MFLATSGGISRTVAHIPAVSLTKVSAAQSWRQRHGAVAGRAAVHVLETADFGFEFAAFFLFSLGEMLVSSWICWICHGRLTLNRRTPSARVSRIIFLNSWRMTMTLVVSLAGRALVRSPAA